MLNIGQLDGLPRRPEPAGSAAPRSSRRGIPWRARRY